MDQPITTRLPKEFVKKIKDIAEKEQLDVSTVIRRLLANALKEWKIKYALEQYAQGAFSFGQLAAFAEVSVWDVPDLLKKHNVHINYDEEELQRDLKFIKKWKAKS